jgi:hypothetical protein
MSKYSSTDDLIYEPDAQSASRGLAFAIIALVFLMVGIGVGLFYAWQISPVVEKNTRPDQLRDEDRLSYIVAIALDYAYQGDLNRTYRLLSEVDPQTDPFQLAAEAACELKNSGRIRTSTDIEAARYLISIFQVQPGILANCDLTVFATSLPPTLVTPIPTPIIPPTPIPAATKTPTPQFFEGDTPPPAVVTPRTTLPGGQFEFLTASQFCNPQNSGMIEVYVREAGTGKGVPGIEVGVQWNTSGGTLRQSFYTGLKPNRGDGYADFQMEAAITYQVSLPGRGAVSPRLEATPCDEDGTLRGYQVIFQSP